MPCELTTAPTGPFFRREEIEVLKIPQKLKLYTLARKHCLIRLRFAIPEDMKSSSRRVPWKDAHIHREDLEGLHDRDPYKTGMHSLIEHGLIRDLFRAHPKTDEIKGVLNDLPESLVRAVLEHVLEHLCLINEASQIQPKDEEAFLPFGDIPEGEPNEEKLDDEDVHDTDLRARKRRRH